MGSCTACDELSISSVLFKAFVSLDRKDIRIFLILLNLSLVQDFTVAKAYRQALLCCSPEQTLVFLALIKPVLRDEQRNSA